MKEQVYLTKLNEPVILQPLEMGGKLIMSGFWLVDIINQHNGLVSSESSEEFIVAPKVFQILWGYHETV